MFLNVILFLKINYCLLIGTRTTNYFIVSVICKTMPNDLFCIDINCYAQYAFMTLYFANVKYIFFKYIIMYRFIYFFILIDYTLNKYFYNKCTYTGIQI